MRSLILVPFLAVAVLAGTEYQARVKGKIACKSARDGTTAKVVLYDKDKMSKDDVMGQQIVAFRRGEAAFDVAGKASDLAGKIEPYLIVNHKCGKSKETASQKFVIPAEFVTKAKEPAKTYYYPKTIKLD